jgi:hypothetical protein
MPGDMSGAIASQTGASAGLWTHTPVDWRGNEPPGTAKPGGWPTDAAVATPPNGSTSGGLGTAPLLSAISSGTITSTGATISFTVAPSSVCYVDYGTTVAYGASTATTTGSGALTRPITGLVTGTLYHYRVVATANGLTTYSSDRTFTTT